jgi:hypothetical protein
MSANGVGLQAADLLSPERSEERERIKKRGRG